MRVALFGVFGVFPGQFEVFLRVFCLRIGQLAAVEEEIVSVEARPDGEEAVHQAVGEVVGVVFDFVAVVAAFQHHHCRPGDDQREDDFDEGAEGEQAGTDDDENHAEDDGADDAPVEHTVAVAFRHLEPGENRHHHEEVIDGKYFFQGVTGDEQARCFAAVVPAEEAGEGERDENPEDGPE